MTEKRALDDPADADVTTEPQGSMVVGHDRSAGAQHALEVTLQLAAELGARVVVVRAWSVTTAPRPANWKFGYVSSFDELAEAVRDELVSDVSSLVAQYPDVPVTYRAYHSSPASSLIEASQNARMLVVGSRGLGGFRQMTLGSVSEQCVRHAQCPVLVTRLPA